MRDEQRGKLVEGPTSPYKGFGGYVKATPAPTAEDPDRVFIEMHFAFNEPYAWFKGPNVLAAKMLDVPVVNAKADLPRYRVADYGEWRSAADFAPLSFDRPEPYNLVPEHVDCTDRGRRRFHAPNASDRCRCVARRHRRLRLDAHRLRVA